MRVSVGQTRGAEQRCRILDSAREFPIRDAQVLHRHLLRLGRAARARYEQLLADAVVAGELRADTDVQAMARMIEVTLGGSFLAWTIYREGPAAKHLLEDLDATLRPYLTHGRRAGRVTT